MLDAKVLTHHFRGWKGTQQVNAKTELEHLLPAIAQNLRFHCETSSGEEEHPKLGEPLTGPVPALLDRRPAHPDLCPIPQFSIPGSETSQTKDE